MNTPTDRIFRLTYITEHIHLTRMLITDITISPDTYLILYQVPFGLTASPSRAWKEVLMETWHSLIQHNESVSNTVIWVFHNRIMIDKVSIELVKNELETLLAVAIEKTNKQMKMRSQLVI